MQFLLFSLLFCVAIVTAKYVITPKPIEHSLAIGTSVSYNVMVTAGTIYPAGAVPPNELFGVARIITCADCFGGKKVTQLLGHAPEGRGSLQFNDISITMDGKYNVTWFYYCGNNDNNGDTDCGGKPHTPSGCRPGIFVVNNVQLPDVNQFPCFPGTWEELHTISFTVDFKAGNNSLKIFSNSADCADLEGISVDDMTTNIDAVILSVSGLPNGVTATFNQALIPGSGLSTLWISTTSAVTPGIYPIKISGIYGNEIVTSMISLVLKAP